MSVPHGHCQTPWDFPEEVVGTTFISSLFLHRSNSFIHLLTRRPLQVLGSELPWAVRETDPYPETCLSGPRVPGWRHPVRGEA